MRTLIKWLHPASIYARADYLDKISKDIRKATNAYTDFLEDYELKQEILEEFKKSWDSGSSVSHKKFREIPDLNRKILESLKEIIVDVKRDRDITKSVLYKLVKG